MSISHIAHKALRGARPLCCSVWGAVLCWEVEAEVSLSMCMLLKLLKLLHGSLVRSSGAPVSHLLLSQFVSVFTAASLERRRHLSGGGAEGNAHGGWTAAERVLLVPLRASWSSAQRGNNTATPRIPYVSAGNSQDSKKSEWLLDLLTLIAHVTYMWVG